MKYMGLYLINSKSVLISCFRFEVNTKEVDFDRQQHPEVLECLWSIFDLCVTFKIQSSLNAMVGLIPCVAPYC